MTTYEKIQLDQACAVLKIMIANKDACARFEQAHSQVQLNKAWKQMKPRTKNILVR